MKNNASQRDGLHCSAGVLPANRAYRHAVPIVLFVAVALAGLAADLLSKHLVFQSLLSDPQLPQQVRGFRARYGDRDEKTVLQYLQVGRQACPGVRFTLSTNPGVVFGLPVPRFVVAVATGIAILIVLSLFAVCDRGAYDLHAAFAMILAGALGNLYDRLFCLVALPGSTMPPIRYQVRDFIDCSQLYYKYVFNVADVLLVIGVALLMVRWIIQAKRAVSQAK